MRLLVRRFFRSGLAKKLTIGLAIPRFLAKPEQKKRVA